MARRIAVVALLALLAGCGSLIGAPDPAETVTPASVPDVATTTAADPLPPGLNGGGVYDADALARAHLAALDGLSYTWHSRTVFAGNSSDRHLEVESPRRYSYRVSSPGARSNTSEFADGEVVYTRYFRFVERLRRAPAPNATAQYGPIAAGAVERYLAVENATVAETLVDGDLHYRVRATTDRYRAIEGATNYSVTAVIAPDGFVRELSVSYAIGDDEHRIEIRYSFRYDAVGNTTVEEPAWLRGEWATDPTETPT